MKERNQNKLKTTTNVRISVLRKLLLCMFFVVVVGATCGYAISTKRQEKPELLEPQKIAVKSAIYSLMGQIEKFWSFYDYWPAVGKRPGKNEAIEASKKIRMNFQPLEQKLGPVEIRVDETFDEATLVLVPTLYGKWKNLSTGKITELKDQNIGDLLLEKQETSIEQSWLIISSGNPKHSKFESLLNFPRKKVQGSPTIILKKAVTLQVISDNNDINEENILWDEDVSSKVINGLSDPQKTAVKQRIYLYMDRFKETLSFFAPGWPGKDKDKIIEVWKKVHTRRQSLELELGPLEIRENETVDKATRVVVPVLSEKVKNLSTGKVKVLPDHELGDLLLEKQQTPEGQQWRIISAFDPNYAEIESTWLKLPRKKVPGSPRIILKKAILMQVISDDGKIVDEKTILFDERIGKIGTVVEK